LIIKDHPVIIDYLGSSNIILDHHESTWMILDYYWLCRIKLDHPGS